MAWEISCDCDVVIVYWIYLCNIFWLFQDISEMTYNLPKALSLSCSFEVVSRKAICIIIWTNNKNDCKYIVNQQKVSPKEWGYLCYF